MIRIREATVHSILASDEEITEALIDAGGALERALNYNLLTGPLRVGDRVVLNTTALHLGLGTGGYHFVIHVHGSPDGRAFAPNGHAMKLRYTPLQLQCLTVEEQGSPYRELMEAFEGLAGMPVIAGSLHSMLGPAAAGARAAAPEARIAYVMTDGGALPLAFSHLVRRLKGIFIDATITAGQAFGGDYEAVNLYSALVAAKQVAQADLAIVSMGPGKLGTATKYGFSEIEQGEVVNAISVLGGTAVAVPRISFGRPGYRHYGLSPHTVTALGEVAMRSSHIVVPLMKKKLLAHVRKQLDGSGLGRRHTIVFEDGQPALDALAREGIVPTTMGRNAEEEKEYFLAAGAAGAWAGGLLNERCAQPRVAAR